MKKTYFLSLGMHKSNAAISNDVVMMNDDDRITENVCFCFFKRALVSDFSITQSWSIRINIRRETKLIVLPNLPLSQNAPFKSNQDHSHD